jgi:hypothetical protein
MRIVLGVPASFFGQNFDVAPAGDVVFAEIELVLRFLFPFLRFYIAPRKKLTKIIRADS